MSQQKIQNSQQTAVGEALAALTQWLIPTPGPSNTPHTSPAHSDYIVKFAFPEEDEAEGNSQGRGAQSDHDGNQEPDHNLDDNQVPNWGASTPTYLWKCLGPIPQTLGK